MNEKQLMFLFENYASDKGFTDYDEFKGLMSDENARKVFFENSNPDLGFTDYDEFNNVLGVGIEEGKPVNFTEGSVEQQEQPTEPLEKPIVDVDRFDVPETDEYLSGAREAAAKKLKETEELLISADIPDLPKHVIDYPSYNVEQLDSALTDIGKREKQTNFILSTRGLTQPQRTEAKKQIERLEEERAAAIVYKAEKTNDYSLVGDAVQAVRDVGYSSAIGKKLRPEVYKLESRVSEDIFKEIEGVDIYDLTEIDFNGIRRADVDKVADLADKVAESIADGNPGVRQIAYEKILNEAEEYDKTKKIKEKIESDAEIQDILSNYRTESLSEFESTNDDGIKYRAELVSTVDSINNNAQSRLNKLVLDYNSDVDLYKQELISQVQQGIITNKEANKQLKDYNTQLYSELESSNNLVIENNKKDIEEVSKEYYKKIEGGFNQFLLDNPMDPSDVEKLQSSMKKIYEEVDEGEFAYLKAQENLQSLMFGSATSLVTSLGKSYYTELGRAVSSKGTLFNLPWMTELGDEMMTSFSVADERVEDWSDLANVPAVVKSVGRLAGSATTSIVVGGITGAATGGLGTIPAMSAVATASLLSESVDMAGGIKRDIIKETGSLLKGEQGAEAMWKAQMGNWWTYLFDGLPYVGKALRGVSSKAAKIGIVGLESSATETVQETRQTAQEQKIMQSVMSGEEISARGFGELITPGLVKSTFLEVAPGSFFLGGSTRAVTEFMMDKKADKLAKEIIVKTRAGLVDNTDSFIRQKIFASMNQFGKNFTNSWLATLQKNGAITEEELGKLYTYSKTAEGFLRNVKGLNLTEEQMNTYFALSNRANELYDKAESITDDKVTRATLTEQANALKKNAQDFLNNPETGGSFVSVKIGKSPAIIMNEEQAIEFVTNNPYVVLPESGVDIVARNADEFGGILEQMAKGVEAATEATPVEEVAPTVDTEDVETAAQRLANRTKEQKNLFGDQHTDKKLPYKAADISDITTTDKNGVTTATYVNPETNSVDVIITATNKGNFVGYTRVYENGKPTDMFTAKMQASESGKFKNIITSAENALPDNVEVVETSTISTGGLKSYNKSRLVEKVDEDGNVVTRPTKYSDATKESVKEKGEAAYRPFKTTDKSAAEAEIAKIKEAYPGINTKIIETKVPPIPPQPGKKPRGKAPNQYSISIDLPVLVKPEGMKSLAPTEEAAPVEEAKPAFSDNRVPLKEETFTVTDEDGGRQEVTVRTYLDGSFGTGARVKRFDSDGTLIDDSGAFDVNLADNDIVIRDGITAEQAVKNALANESQGDVVEKTGERIGADFMNPKMLERLTNKQRERLGLTTPVTEAVEEAPTGEQKLKDISEGRVVTFTYPNKQSIPDIFKDKVSSTINVTEKRGASKTTYKVTISQSEADYLLAQGKVAPTVDTEGVETTTELTEEQVSELNKFLGLDKSKRKASRKGITKKDNQRLDKVERAVDLLEQSLSEVMPNIVISVAEDSDMFARFAGEQEEKKEDRSKGLFTRVDGTYVIVLNPDSADVTTVFHEGLHAVLVAAGLPNTMARAVTSRMVEAVKKTATKKLQRELEAFTELYETPLQSEEYIAELIGILANNYNEQNNETKSIIRRWLQKLAEMLGLKPKGVSLSTVGLNNTDAATIDALNFVAKKMSEGGVLTEQDLTRLTQLGQEAATSLIMEEEISTPGSQILGGTGIRKSKQAKVEDFDTTPPKVDGVKMIYPEKTSIDDVLEKSGGAAIFINSDGTKVGKVTLNGRELILQGGIDYTFIEQNVKDDIGFAASEDKKISQLKTAASDLVAERDRKNPEHKGKPIAVFVASQNGETMLGEWYAAEYIMEGLDESIVNKKYKGGLRQAEKDFVKAIKSAKVGKTEDGLRDKKSKDALLKMVEDGKFKTREGRLDIAKKLASKDFSFGFRVNLNKDLLSNKELASKTGKNVNFKKSLAESGYFLNDFWNRFIDERFLKGIQQQRLQNEKGKTVSKKTFSGFFYDPSESLESQINHAKLGVDHAQFNSSFKSQGNFLLDSAYDVNKLFPLMGYPEQKGIDIYNEANNTKFVKETPKRNPLGLVRATIVDKGMISKWLKENGYSNLIVNPYTSIALSLYTGVSEAEETVTRKQRRKKPKSKVKDAFEWGMQKGVPAIAVKNHLIKLGYTEEEITSGAYDAEKIWNKDGKKVVKWLDYGRRAALSARKFRPQTMFLAKEAMESSISAELRQAKMMAENLNRAINKYKSQDKRDELIDAVDEFMRDAEERDFWRNELPDDIAQIAEAMRVHIDSLSLKLVDSGVIKAERSRENILANIGVYMNRSYQVFDNKNWKEEVSEQVITAAQNHLREAYYNSLNGIKELDQQLKDGKITESEYNRRKNRILSNKASVKEIMDRDNVSEDEALTMHVDDIIDSILSKRDVNEYILFAQPKVGKKDLSSLKRRKDIPPAIRALMGEYTDPGYNYAMSIFKIANLVENQKYLTKIRDAGLGVWLFEKEAGKKIPEGYEKITFKGDASMNPLDGLYAPKEVKEAFNDIELNRMISGIPKIGWLYGYWLKGVGAVKYNKTILSYGTHAKNVIGNMYFMAQNGYLDPREYQQPFIALVKQFSGKELTAEQEAKMDEWVRAGIIGQGATIGEIKSFFEGEDSFEKALTKRIDKKTDNMLSKVGKGVKKFGEKAQEAYQYEDDMFKIVAYEKEKLNYSKILFDGKSYNKLDASQQSTVNDYVAEIIKNILPNYGRIGGLGKGLKAFPIAGTFISFQIEAYRTAYNTVALAIQEIKGDIPGISETGKKLVQKRGVMRLMSIVGFQAFKYGLISLLGIPLIPGDDDDEDGLSEKIRTLLPFWDTNSDISVREVKPNGNFTYVSISASDPYGSIFKVVNATKNLTKTGEGFSEIFGELAGPFVSEDILLNTFRNISSNENDYGGKIWRNTDTPFEKSEKIALQLGKTFEPGAMTSTRKIIQSENKLNEALGQFTGFKLHEVKSLEQAGFKFGDIQKKAQESKSAYNSIKYNMDDYETQEDINKVIRASKKAMDEDYQEAVKLYQALISLGVSDRDIKKKMYDYGISGPMRSQIARNSVDVKLNPIKK
jgi:hypothetical protein